MTSADDILSVQGLTVKYSGFTALESLSFDAYPGELLGILGPNGAGKTTLVKAICGRVTPQGGSIKIGNQKANPRAVTHDMVGIVPQEIGLYPFLTAQENLETFAAMYGLPQKERAAAVVSSLRAVKMTEHASKPVSSLSGGMKRRINFAAAILNRPKVLILDEPTAGVDVAARDTIHQLARDVASEGLVVLLVTHELDQAELICDRALVLSRGRKRFHDTPENILSSVYRSSHLVTFRLQHQPSAGLAATLSDGGLVESESPLDWRGLVPGSVDHLIRRTTEDVERGQNRVREVIAKRPGFEHLLGQIVREAYA